MDDIFLEQRLERRVLDKQRKAKFNIKVPRVERDNPLVLRNYLLAQQRAAAGVPFSKELKKQQKKRVKGRKKKVKAGALFKSEQKRARDAREGQRRPEDEDELVRTGELSNREFGLRELAQKDRALQLEDFRQQREFRANERRIRADLVTAQAQENRAVAGQQLQQQIADREAQLRIADRQQRGAIADEGHRLEAQRLTLDQRRIRDENQRAIDQANFRNVDLRLRERELQELRAGRADEAQRIALDRQETERQRQFIAAQADRQDQLNRRERAELREDLFRDRQRYEERLERQEARFEKRLEQLATPIAERSGGTRASQKSPSISGGTPTPTGVGAKIGEAPQPEPEGLRISPEQKKKPRETPKRLTTAKSEIATQTPPARRRTPERQRKDEVDRVRQSQQAEVSPRPKLKPGEVIPGKQPKFPGQFQAAQAEKRLGTGEAVTTEGLEGILTSPAGRAFVEEVKKSEAVLKGD